MHNVHYKTVTLQTPGKERSAFHGRSRAARKGLTGASVLEGEVLVSELGSVDGLAASAVAGGEVTSLHVQPQYHKESQSTLQGERSLR